MESHRKNTALSALRNERGIAIILVAVTFVLVLVFFLIFIDIAFIYYTRGQVHNAADSGALAGAGVLEDPLDTSQPAARAEAVKFAAENTVAGADVVLESDGSNTLSAGNDITVGTWNQSTRTYTPGTTPVNAVEVRPRRTADPDITAGAVELFFGRIVNTPTVDIAQTAIAARLARAVAPISICFDTCALVPPPGGLLLYWGPESQIPGNEGIAWTVFDDSSQSTPTKDIADFFCGKEKDACGLTVYSNNGVNSSAMSEFRCAFKNPNYDSANKTCTPIGGSTECGDNVGDTVVDWKVLVPVFSTAGCPPGTQPNPYDIVSYAEVTVDEVFAKGNGNRCACDACNASGASCGGLTGPQPTAIRVTAINCVACPATSILGNRARLVR